MPLPIFFCSLDRSEKRDLFLVEPEPTDYDIRFRLFGVPVRVHPLFWLTALLLGGIDDMQPKLVLLWIVVAFVSVLVHEFGHAVAIRHYGWRPWITLYGLGGLASYEPGLRNTYESYAGRSAGWLPQVVIALAGPLAGFLFLGAIVAGVKLGGGGVNFHWGGPTGITWRLSGFQQANLAELVRFLIFANLYWGLLNLLPIYPLDGGKVARELAVVWGGRRGVEWSLAVSMATAGLVAVYALFFWSKPLFSVLMFGYLAFISYQMLQAIRQAGWQNFQDEDDDDFSSGGRW